jgi:hypothetical protein
MAEVAVHARKDPRARAGIRREPERQREVPIGASTPKPQDAPGQETERGTQRARGALGEMRKDPRKELKNAALRARET